jgi:transcriptional regulator with XRE-family HTH domain
MDQGVGREVKRLREQRDWSQAKLAVEAEMSVSGVSMIENGQRNLTTTTLGKLANAFGIGIADLFPKAQSSSPEPSFDDVLNDEQRAAWEASVAHGRDLRETGRARMWKALSEWSASKRRDEPYAVRRKYLDEMGDLLQEVYDAGAELGWAYIQAALTQGGSDASVPSYLREESRKTDQFYGQLFELAVSRKLGISTSADVIPVEYGATIESVTGTHSVQEAG